MESKYATVTVMDGRTMVRYLFGNRKRSSGSSVSWASKCVNWWGHNSKNIVRGKTMDLKKLQEELTFDEGCIDKIYLDHLGYPTFGIGHLILETDPEHGQDVDTPVSKERIDECFENDIQNVINDLDRNLVWWRDLPEDLQRVMANMCFNLGITRLLKFKKFLGAMEDRNWDKAAVEMLDSRWAIQVGPRAIRLKDRVLKQGENL